MKKLLLVLVLLAAVLAGVACWISRPRTVAMEEATFTYAAVERGSMVEAVSGTGVLQPKDLVVVSSELPGLVAEIHGKANDIVSEGDVLLRLDERKARLKLEEAQDGIETARAALVQAEALQDAAELALKYQMEIESRGGFRSERDQAEVKYKAAQAGVTMARVKLRATETLRKQAQLVVDQTLVKVPAAPETSTAQRVVGKRVLLILERKAELGQMVDPAAPLFSLAGDLRHMEVHTEIAEGDIDRVRKGLVATFTISASSEPDIHFRGTVREIRPVPTSVHGAVFYNVILDVTNQKNPETQEWRLRPGMTAAVDILRLQHSDVWKVPSAALNFQLEEGYQTDAARTRLAEWRARSDRLDWRAVWVWDAGRGSPWPVFVRVADEKAGKVGIKDGEYNEVLEWEPEWEPAAGARGPRVLINAPPAREPGLFDQPANFKLS